MGPKAKKAARKNPINTELKSSGIMRLSRGRMFHKRGLWHIEKWKKQNEKKTQKKTAAKIVKKTVKGDKNGGSRNVRVTRFVSIFYSLICLSFLLLLLLINSNKMCSSIYSQNSIQRKRSQENFRQTRKPFLNTNTN